MNSLTTENKIELLKLAVQLASNLSKEDFYVLKIPATATSLDKTELIYQGLISLLNKPVS